MLSLKKKWCRKKEKIKFHGWVAWKRTDTWCVRTCNCLQLWLMFVSTCFCKIIIMKWRWGKYWLSTSENLLSTRSNGEIPAQNSHCYWALFVVLIFFFAGQQKRLRMATGYNNAQQIGGINWEEGKARSH